MTVADSHIGSVEITTIGPVDDDPLVAGYARAFAVAVWSEVDRALERARPGMIVHIREWSDRWTVTEDELRSCSISRVVAATVRACLQFRPVGETGVPDSGGGAHVVWFEGEPERIAGWLAARGSNRARSWWPWRDLEARGDPLLVLTALTGDELVEVLTLLGDRFDEALEPLGPALAALVERLAALEGPPPDRLIRPDLEPTSRRGAQPTDPWRVRVEDMVARLRDLLDRPTGLSVGDRRGARPPGQPEAMPPPAARLPAGRRPADERDATDSSDGVDPEPRQIRPIGTSWAGLVYLLRPTIRCRVGSALWEACLPESDVIHAAFSVVAGTDPIVGALTGSDGAQLPRVGLEQLGSVRGELLASFEPDEVGPLRLAHRGATTSAHDSGRAWPIAAWVDTPVELCVEELRMHGYRVEDDEAVAEVELDLEPAQQALVAMVLGVPTTRLALDLRVRERSIGDFAARWLAGQGSIRFDDDVVTVVVPGASIDLELRRIGADADPGWLAWARRTVRIEFDVGEVG